MIAIPRFRGGFPACKSHQEISMYTTKNAPVKRDWLVAALNRGAVNPQPRRVEYDRKSYGPPAWGLDWRDLH